MPEFRDGFESHALGFDGNPYDADSVAAQAWDRGLGGRSAPRWRGQHQLSELDAAGARLSAETGMPYTPAASGQMVAGVYRQPLTLTSGRFAVIDNGQSFALVPWTSDLERARRQRVRKGRMMAAFRPVA